MGVGGQHHTLVALHPGMGRYPFFTSSMFQHIIYFLHIFLPNPSYMFRCVTHHPQGELRILAQYCQLFTRLLHELYYKVRNFPYL